MNTRHDRLKKMSIVVQVSAVKLLKKRLQVIFEPLTLKTKT